MTADGASLPPKNAYSRRKKAVEEEGHENNESATPKTAPRKRAAKNQEVDGEDSPKKKTSRAEKADAAEVQQEDMLAQD